MLIMVWNWELADWPHFTYQDEKLVTQEKHFIKGEGGALAYLKSLPADDYRHFLVEILSTEGQESAKIEGEVLDRESLQSSIKHHFNLSPSPTKLREKESAMAKVLCNVYQTYKEPLSHHMLWQWHRMLFQHTNELTDIGQYRSFTEPMQIVANRPGFSKVFFEAPPSTRVASEMDAFVRWFNETEKTESILGRAALAHVYFESIHPFEDGNGRIGRILVEKVLSQGAGQPVLIAVSKLLEKGKKKLLHSA